MWEALEGKRIAEGKRISEGKRIAEGKMNCWRGIASKSEGQDFKKGKERTWDSASLGQIL
jgi:hypothetical protein